MDTCARGTLRENLSFFFLSFSFLQRETIPREICLRLSLPQRGFDERFCEGLVAILQVGSPRSGLFVPRLRSCNSLELKLLEARFFLVKVIQETRGETMKIEKRNNVDVMCG